MGAAAAACASSPGLRPAWAPSCPWPGRSPAGAGAVGVARGADRLDGLRGGLRAHTPASATFTCDVADTRALRRPWTGGAGQGPVDVLVNDAARIRRPAGRHRRGGLPPHLRRQLLAGRRHLAVIPAWSSGSGTIINVSSDGGRLPRPGREPTLVEGGPVGVQRVGVVPARPQGGAGTCRLSGVHGDGARARGARPAACVASSDDHAQCADGVPPDPGASGGPR